MLATIKDVHEGTEFPASHLEDSKELSTRAFAQYVQGQLLPWYLRCRKAAALNILGSRVVHTDLRAFVQHSIRENTNTEREPWEAAFEGDVRNMFEQASATALSVYGLRTNAIQMYQDLRPFLRTDANS